MSKTILSYHHNSSSFTLIELLISIAIIAVLMSITAIAINPSEMLKRSRDTKRFNDLSNLEWISRSDNVKHSREVLGLIPIPYSKSDKIHHLKDKTGDNSNKGIKIKATLLNNEIKKLLFTATGALHSPTASLQGESIPGIAHCLGIEV